MQCIRHLGVNTANEEAGVVSPPHATTAFAALLSVQGRRDAACAAGVVVVRDGPPSSPQRV
jgi:hypothetical protein